MEFAKLFGSGEDQIAIILDQSETRPGINFFFQPPYLGLRRYFMTYAATDDGRRAAREYFDKMSEDVARMELEKGFSAIYAPSFG